MTWIPAALRGLAALLVLVLLASISCAAPQKTGLSSPAFEALAGPPDPAVAREQQRVLAEKRAEAARHAPAPSHHLATIARRAIGPLAARSGDAAIVAWIVGAERGGSRDLVAVTAGADGAPHGAPRVLASVPQEATTLVVRPAGGTQGGWLLAWSSLLDRGESLTVLGVAPDGTARGEPTDVERTSDHVKWADVLPTAGGGVCVWAEETSSGDANILTIGLDTSGKPRGMPSRVARGVSRWQAVRAGDGVGLALVTAGPRDETAAPAGKLSWMRLDGEGRPAGEAVAIGSKPTVGGDVDVVPFRDGWLLGWTDRTGEDAQVMLALIDGAGHTTGPKHALDSVGGSWLVSLASDAQGAVVAWEEPRSRVRTTHALHLAMLPNDSSLEARTVTSLEIATSVVPEVVATDQGFMLLASARSCPDEGVHACAAPYAPTYVRFGARLDSIQVEPIVLQGTKGDRVDTSIAWGLRCLRDGCFALAASNELPTRVFMVDLAARKSPFAASPLPAVPPDAPRMNGIQTIASGRPYEDLAAATLGDSTIVAALAQGVADDPSTEGGDGRAGSRKQPPGATITLRTLDADGRPKGAASTLTSRAVAVGGVAMAPAGRVEDGAAIAWVGQDAGDLQVHVAHLDRRGRRNNEIQLTTAKGDASSVAIAWAGDGWIVAWVDARDGNGEVYASKVDRDLSRVAREERITTAPGDAGDVALAVNGDVVWVAWSDPRESPREGLSDIYVATLRAHDARRTGEEVRVLATAPHSRSPQLAALGDGEGAIVAWVEDVATGLEGPGAAFVARLDRTGKVSAAPALLPLAAPGRPTAIALAPASRGRAVHAIVVRSTGDAVTLDALALGADGAPSTPPSPLFELDAAASFEVALALAGDGVFFDDIGGSPGDHRVRRATVSWRR